MGGGGVLQWIDGVLSKGEKMNFFHDEFGCPVYVKDVVAIIRALTSRWISGIILQYRSLNTSNIDDKLQNVIFSPHHSFGSYIQDIHLLVKDSLG